MIDSYQGAASAAPQRIENAATALAAVTVWKSFPIQACYFRFLPPPIFLAFRFLRAYNLSRAKGPLRVRLNPAAKLFFDNLCLRAPRGFLPPNSLLSLLFVRVYV